MLWAEREKRMHAIVESIAQGDAARAHHVRLEGVDCPVERMLVASAFRAGLPGWRVAVNPAFPGLYIFPARREGDDEPDRGELPEAPAEEHVLALAQHRIQPRDFPLFAAAVLVMAAMYLPVNPLALNGVGLALALAVCARFRPRHARLFARGLALGWPAPALLAWCAALLPLLPLPGHLLGGTAAPRLVDGAIVLFMYQVLREQQGEFMAVWFASGDPRGREKGLGPIEEFAAQFVLWLSLLLAAAAFFLWLAFPPVRSLAEWFDSLTFVQMGWEGRVPLDGAVAAALALLVMPPAATLLLLAPALYAVCLRRAGARGIHCESVASLNTLNTVQMLALRKTSVLTEGHPTVKEIVCLGGANEDEIVRIAAGLEACSSHPLADAIRRHARRKYIEFTAAEETEERAGLGVIGQAGGTLYYLGSAYCMQELGIELSGARHVLYRLGKAGYVPVVLSDGEKALGIIALWDPLRGDSVRLCRALQELEVTPVLLSQNSADLTRTIAEQCGAPKHLAERNEPDLAAALRQYQKERIGRTAILCLRAPHRKLRACADLVIAQRRNDEAIGAMAADLEVGDGLRDVVWLLRLIRTARTIRHHVLGVILLLLCAGWGLAFTGALPAISAPFVPGFFAYYLHLHCGRLDKLEIAEVSEGGAA